MRRTISGISIIDMNEFGKLFGIDPECEIVNVIYDPDRSIVKILYVDETVEALKVGEMPIYKRWTNA